MTNPYPIFHRGWVDSSTLPNTQAAFEKAVTNGGGNEIDIRPTSDNVIVISHEDSVSGKRISGTTASELNLMPLSDALTYTKTSVTLLDLKDDVWSDAALVALGSTIRAQNCDDRVYVFSNDWPLLARLKNLAPNVKTLLRAVDVECLPPNVRANNADGILATESYLGTFKVKRMRESGFLVYVITYSVNSKAAFDRVGDLNVNGLVIDTADWNAWKS